MLQLLQAMSEAKVLEDQCLFGQAEEVLSSVLLTVSILVGHTGSSCSKTCLPEYGLYHLCRAESSMQICQPQECDML